MRTSSLLLSAALLASVASAAWLWNELDAERTHSAELAAQLARQSVERQRVIETTASAVNEPMFAPAAIPQSAATAIAVPPPPLPKIVFGTEQEWNAYQSQLLRDPKYREALRAQERLKYGPRRANLIRLLGFTAEQALRQQEEGLMHGASEEARQQARARFDAIEREQQNKLSALLSESKRLRLQGYMESRESRMQVDDLRTALSEAHALRDDQVEPLIAALHVERARAQSELREFRETLNSQSDSPQSWGRYGERKTELMKAMNARMHASASSILSGPQLDALDEQTQQELAQYEARQHLSRIQSKLEQANQAPPN